MHFVTPLVSACFQFRGKRKIFPSARLSEISQVLVLSCREMQLSVMVFSAMMLGVQMFGRWLAGRWSDGTVSKTDKLTDVQDYYHFKYTSCVAQDSIR